MALFTNNSGIQLPSSAQPPASGSEDELFRFVPTGLSQGAQTTIAGMFDGSGNDAARARTNEALARSAQQYRASGGSQLAPLIGQGAAIRGQQGIEQGIMQTVADTQLGFAEQEQGMRERAVGMTMALEQQGLANSQDIFNRRMGSVNLLLQSGGAANTESAREVLDEMYPGVEFDFSNANLNSGMATLAQFVSTGLSEDQAMAMAVQQGIPQSLGMDEAALRNLYHGMLVQANPMLATLSQLEQFGSELGMDQASIAAMQDNFMETTTGMEMERQGDGTWKVIPFDGFTRVSSLYNVVPGDMVKTDRALTTPLGTSVPPGKYTITTSTWKNDKTVNAWDGTQSQRTYTSVWAVAEDGTKYQVSQTFVDNEKDMGSGVENIFDPLGLFG